MLLLVGGLVVVLLFVKGLLLWLLGCMLGGLDGNDVLCLVVLLVCGGEFVFVVFK